MLLHECRSNRLDLLFHLNRQAAAQFLPTTLEYIQAEVRFALSAITSLRECNGASIWAGQNQHDTNPDIDRRHIPESHRSLNAQEPGEWIAKSILMAPQCSQHILAGELPDIVLAKTHHREAMPQAVVVACLERIQVRNPHSFT